MALKPKEVIYLNALAGIAFDASARGSHTLPQPEWIPFFKELMRDKHLDSDEAQDLFGELFDYTTVKRKPRNLTL